MRGRMDKAWRLIDERVLGLMALLVETLFYKMACIHRAQLSAISLKIVIRFNIIT